MAQVIVEFGPAMAPQVGKSAAAPVFSPFAQTEEVTSSGTSAATTMTAVEYDVASIYSSGNVWVTFGASPTAAVGTTSFIAAGTRRDFGPLGVGMKCAVIDDS